MSQDIEDEKPLDPVLENVRRKLVRRMAWSIGIMMLGLATVLGAIVYRISSDASTNKFVGFEAPYSLSLPQGAQLLDSDLDGDNILLRIRLADGQVQLLMFDVTKGEILSRIDVEQ